MPIPPDVVRDHILRGFRVLGRGRARRGPYQARLSQAGKCVRALSYHRQGYPESDPMPVRVGLVFEVGDALHEWMDRQLQRLGLPVQHRERRLEIRTPGGLVVTGHFDRAIGDSVTLDYKSASDASFRYMADRDEPLPDHRAQIVGYLEACRRDGADSGLSTYTPGLIVAVNKDTQDVWVSPPIPHDPALAQATLEKFDEVERHAQRGTLSERPYASPREYPCAFCSWRSLCWGAALPTDDGARESAWRPTAPTRPGACSRRLDIARPGAVRQDVGKAARSPRPFAISRRITAPRFRSPSAHVSLPSHPP